MESAMSGYSQKMLLKLKVLMHKEQFCDVEIIVQVRSRLSKVQNSMWNVQGRHILCHKVVLASASEYFENMFRSLSISSHIIFSLNMEFKDEWIVAGILSRRTVTTSAESTWTATPFSTRSTPPLLLQLSISSTQVHIGFTIILSIIALHLTNGLYGLFPFV